MQYYLPDESAINKDFLRQILAGEKHLLKKREVNFVTAPKYDEISVKQLFPTFAGDKHFL